MQTLGDQLLAGAALANHEHWAVQWRGAARPLDGVEKGKALPYELIGPLHVRIVGVSHHPLARYFTSKRGENPRFFECFGIFATLA
jgi:hypothetical protein